MSTTDHSSESDISGRPEQERDTEGVIDGVKEQARHLASDATQGAKRLAEERTGLAADYLKDVSAALRRGCDALNDSGRGQSASLAAQAADGLESIATSLGRQKPGELLQEIEEAARQHPALFFGGALLAGFGAVRFLKSSAAGRRSSPEPDRAA